MNNAGEAPKDEFSDLEECLRPIAAQYGRDMLALVMNAGVAQEAVKVLAAMAEKHRSQHSAHAVGMVSQAFNQVANALVVTKGWEEGTLAQCDRDIMRAFAGKIAVPQGSRILLNS